MRYSATRPLPSNFAAAMDLSFAGSARAARRPTSVFLMGARKIARYVSRYDSPRQYASDGRHEINAELTTLLITQYVSQWDMSHAVHGVSCCPELELTFNQVVVGSIPTGLTIFIRDLARL